jgi:sulfatase maturation enzyme AslB (radical SAM superfamily)
MNKPLIFYGAGQYARENLSRLISEGLNPVCFCDVDINKHYKRFVGIKCEENYEILPLNEAIQRYPNYLIYITLSIDKLRKITDWLIKQGIPIERIKYIDNVELKKGCCFLGKSMVLSNKELNTCCIKGGVKRVGNAKENFKIYHEYVIKIMEDLKSNKPTICDGCVYLKEDFFEIEPKLYELNFSSVQGEDFCNCKCSYCCLYPKPSKEQMDKRHEFIMEHLRYFSKEEKYAGKVLFSAGEISVSPYRDEALEFMLTTKISSYICSNAMAYSDKILKNIKEETGTLLVSMDAGTAETFSKVKGIDCYPKVVENLQKYASHNAIIHLKYIILDGINDNEADILGFFSLVKEINPVLVCLSCNWQKKTLSQNAMNMCRLFVDKVKELNILLWVDYGYFHINDAKELEEYICVT